MSALERQSMRVCFGDFVLDGGTRQLLQGGRERHLEPKAFELLELLVTRRPEAVAKAEIHERLWPGTFVSESSLTGLVAQVRRALGDDRGRERFIRTIHGFGYAFASEGRTERAPVAATRASASRVIWQDRILPLTSGENVLGRDEDVTVRIDAPGVSRRHARIVIGDAEAILEDLASKNGTYLRERRLEAPVRLADGDTFRLGRQLLVFEARRPRSPPAPSRRPRGVRPRRADGASDPDARRRNSHGEPVHIYRFCPWDWIEEIVVLSDAAKTRVEGILGEFPAGSARPVLVRPGWYYP